MENIKSINDIIAMKKTNENNQKSVIQKALDRGLGMLHIDEFADVVGFKINKSLSLKMMWNTFQQNILIYITNELINLFGFKGELKQNKYSLLKLVKKYDIPVIQLTNEEYIQFTGQNLLTPNQSQAQPNNDDVLYPPITKAQLKSKPIHNLIMPRDLKKLLLVVNTAEGDNARDYVISID
jgi:hypothetical protein